MKNRFWVLNDFLLCNNFLLCILLPLKIVMKHKPQGVHASIYLVLSLECFDSLKKKEKKVWLALKKKEKSCSLTLKN